MKGITSALAENNIGSKSRTVQKNHARPTSQKQHNDSVVEQRLNKKTHTERERGRRASNRFAARWIAQRKLKCIVYEGCSIGRRRLVLISPVMQQIGLGNCNMSNFLF